MTHCLTGEEVEVSLDGIPSALGSGFVPLAWRGRESLAHIELADGRVVAVLNAHGARGMDPGFALTPDMTPRPGSTPRHAGPPSGTTSATGKAAGSWSEDAVQVAAASHGALIPPDTHVYMPGAGSLHRISAAVSVPVPAAPVRLPISHGAVTPVPVPVPVSGAGLRPVMQSQKDKIAPRDTSSDPQSQASVSTGAEADPGGSAGNHVQSRTLIPGLRGGVAYDWGHFTGTEYRKRGSHGATVTACGRTYVTGSRSADPDDWSEERRSGREPAPKGGVTVGRTLVAAVDLLSTGRIKVSKDAAELYSSDGSELLAVYKYDQDISIAGGPSSPGTAGDTAGNTSASPEQLAAVLGYMAHHGGISPVAFPHAVQSFISDLYRAQHARRLPSCCCRQRVPGATRQDRKLSARSRGCGQHTTLPALRPLDGQLPRLSGRRIGSLRSR